DGIGHAATGSGGGDAIRDGDGKIRLRSERGQIRRAVVRRIHVGNASRRGNRGGIGNGAGGGRSDGGRHRVGHATTRREVDSVTDIAGARGGAGAAARTHAGPGGGECRREGVGDGRAGDRIRARVAGGDGVGHAAAGNGGGDAIRHG